MSEAKNAILLVGDALLYFTILAALFRARGRIGIGAFFCALGVMHFLETYLASTFYVALPFGILASPGSAVLFTGKLMLLLVVYIREDSVVVRQPIYGLLLGNALLIALSLVMRQHDLHPSAPARAADFGLLDEMGALMVWGTAVLFVDCIAMILLYERSRGLLGDRIVARLGLCGVLVLSIDQLAFFAGLHLLTGAPASVLLGGWAAKMAAVAVYTGLAGVYLHWLEPRGAQNAHAPRLADVFDLLTYRERYEDLVARSGRDALTGALDRGQLERQGRARVAEAVREGRPIGLLIVDIDDFKGFNDRFGHAAGDAVLTRIAARIMAAATGAVVFRYGGEEFVVIAEQVDAAGAAALGERIRAAVAEAGHGWRPHVTVSIGTAVSGPDGLDYDGLFAAADAGLYRAKSAGRNCVVAAAGPEPARLAYAS
jgi:diguanylate cyclase (GGDEF)-like protein